MITFIPSPGPFPCSFPTGARTFLSAAVRAASLLPILYSLPLPFRIQAQAQPEPALNSSIAALDNHQKLGPGDRLSYRVLEDKDIPCLGRIKAADKTCQTLAAEIKAALEKDFYYHATVLLAIEQLNKNRGRVYLVGQVRAAGPVEIPGDETFTVSKAILRAGGFGDFADKKHVRITRASNAPASAPNRVFTIDLAEILEKGQTDKDVKLEPGDLIFVPSRLVNF
jgi:polysaccharide biosynthesis/export protein